MDPMATIRETFFQECDEQLGELETGLLAMEGGDADRETINAVFRAVHSIKGGAGAFKLDQLVRFAHTFETALDLIRNDQVAATTEVVKTMLRSADQLADLVKAARAGEVVDEARTSHLLAELAALATSPEDGASVGFQSEGETSTDFDFQPVALVLDIPGADPSIEAENKTVFLIDIRPLPDLYRKGNEVTRLFRELGRLGELDVQCEIDQVPALADIDPEGAYLGWKIKLRSERSLAAVQEVFEFVEGDCALDIRIAATDGPTEECLGSGQSAGGQQHDVIEAGARERPEVDVDLSNRSPATADTRGAAAPASVDAPQPPSAAGKGEAASGATSAVTTIRVDLDRVDRLINLVGELVINQAMLSQRVIEAGVTRRSSVAAGLDELEQLTREIQESVMAIRAQPVKPLFQRMTRIVREIADVTGKSVRLHMEGEATEVDRTVIERLADPLTHMVRNAVDHGLERPDVRLASGKSAIGEVKLSAAHRSGRIAIEISDDGAGIDRQRVKDIAIRKGLIPADVQLTDSEIDNLLFLPGFSTAERISDISGRGVGMDVVKRSIQALGGRIAISSRPGRGSTFSLSLPLTLAVLDGMIVKVAGQTLVVPLTAIIETLRPSPSDIYNLGADARVIANRGAFIPLIDVGRDMGYRQERSDPLSGVVILVESESGTRSALIIDAIQDQRQVVIKSLETNYGHVSGVAAATILGDGRIALILDVDAVVNQSSNGPNGRPSLLAAAG